VKTYRTLFFDLDDTLLDFGAAETAALERLYAEHGLELTPEIEAHYKRVNHRLWRDYENGRIDKDELLATRHAETFLAFGHAVDGAAADALYSGYLEQGHQLVEGALELITRLKAHFAIYVVTNGFSRIQDQRLRGSGLHGHFHGVFVSEDTGFRKPMKGFFDHVFARVPGFHPDHGLIVGDSLNADIRGGHTAGLDTCWFNPKALANDIAVRPTYEIGRLEELYRVLALDGLPAGGL
jgi:2-haloacid dehalogenase